MNMKWIPGLLCTGALFGQHAVHFQSATAGAFRHESKLVKGAPYAAEVVTESVQLLTDGNRIVHKQNGKTFRDGEGRTRRENEISKIGPWPSGGGEALTMVSINDPVAKEHIMLDQKNRTATRIKIGAEGGVAVREMATPAAGAPGEKGKAVVREEIRIRTTEGMTTASAGKPGAIVFHSSDGKTHTMHIQKPEVRSESLGKTTMEGLEVEGTRESYTIAAGAIGNERPIEVVTETWYSAALQITVLKKHKDPRSGETTVRTTAIRRGEPDRSLFSIPADYKVNESKANVRVMKSTGGSQPEIF